MKIMHRLRRLVADAAPARSAPADSDTDLPALARAMALQQRAAAVGFDWPDAGSVLEKLDEERRELAAALRGQGRLEDELGDLFFTLINLTRRLALEPEAVLGKANAKFDRRFRRMQALARERGASLDSLTLDTLEELWAAAKSAED